MSRFSDRLRYLRLQEDLSQSELAEKVGISKSSINMYERGEREPGIEMLESIADYFNVDMGYLLGRSDDPTNYNDPDLIASIPLTYMEACENDVRRAWKMMQSVDRDAHNEAVPSMEQNNKIDGAYLSLAKEAQDAKIDPEDISNFIKLLTKHRTDQ